MLHASLKRFARLALVATAMLTFGVSTMAQSESNAPTPSEDTTPAIGQRTEHTVIAPNGRAVYFETWSGLPGKPVYLTLNGLLYNQKYWDSFLSDLNQTGATIIRCAYSADPESLLAKSAKDAKAFSLDGLVGEMETVLNAAGVEKVTLLTLSFGSIGVKFAAKHPERVDRMVMLSPMILPMDYYDLSGNTTRQWLESIRKIWGEAAYETQWNLVMLPAVVSLTNTHIQKMPGYILPGLTDSQVIDGAIAKIKATRHFDLREETKAKLPRIDIILSGGEDKAIFADQQAFWKKLNPAMKGNFVLLKDAGHAVVGDAPKATLKALEAALEADGSPEKPFVNLEIDKEGTVVKAQPATRPSVSTFGN